MAFRNRALLIAYLGLFIIFCRRRREQYQKTKATLNHSSLKNEMTSSFRKALL